MSKFKHPQDHSCTLDTIQADVNAAKLKGYSEHDLSFSWVTVQALLDHIENLNDRLINMTVNISHINNAKFD